MTFLSANELDDGAVLEADVVVVGSGAAGLSLARKLGIKAKKCFWSKLVILRSTGRHREFTAVNSSALSIMTSQRVG